MLEGEGATQSTAISERWHKLMLWNLEITNIEKKKTKQSQTSIIADSRNQRQKEV